MKKGILVFSLLILLIPLLLPAVHAHCPLCTAAVGAAAVSASYYGVDGSIVGLFVGAFGVSTGMWLAKKIQKKYIPLQSLLIITASFFLTIIPVFSLGKSDPLYFPVLLFGASGTLFNKVYWLNTMLAGSIAGGFITSLGYKAHLFIKQWNDNRVLFPFQGIVLTLLLLGIATLGLSIFLG